MAVIVCIKPLSAPNGLLQRVGCGNERAAMGQIESVGHRLDFLLECYFSFNIRDKVRVGASELTPTTQVFENHASFCRDNQKSNPSPSLCDPIGHEAFKIREHSRGFGRCRI